MRKTIKINTRWDTINILCGVGWQVLKTKNHNDNFFNRIENYLIENIDCHNVVSIDNVEPGFSHSTCIVTYNTN